MLNSCNFRNRFLRKWSLLYPSSFSLCSSLCRSDRFLNSGGPSDVDLYFRESEMPNASICSPSFDRLDPMRTRSFCRIFATDPRNKEYHSSSHAAENESSSEEEKIESEERKILGASLDHVLHLGWTEAALFEAAKKLNYSPSIVSIFPRKGAHLVEYFMDTCLEKLEKEMKEKKEEIFLSPVHEKVFVVLKSRLEIQIPYISTWPQALSIQARPENLATTFRQRTEMAERFCSIIEKDGVDNDDADGSEISRINGWFSKRLMLSTVYSAAEVYMLTDFSPGFRDTWSFLERQIQNSIDAKNATYEASKFVWSFGASCLNRFQKGFEK